jgi:hypothetical protein
LIKVFIKILLNAFGEKQEKEKRMGAIKKEGEIALVWAVLSSNTVGGDSEYGAATERGQNRQ